MTGAVRMPLQRYIEHLALGGRHGAETSTPVKSEDIDDATISFAVVDDITIGRADTFHILQGFSRNLAVKGGVRVGRINILTFE